MSASQLTIIVYRDTVERAKQVWWRFQPIVIPRRTRRNDASLLLQVQRARLLEVTEIGSITPV